MLYLTVHLTMLTLHFTPGTAAHKMLTAIEEAVSLLNPNISVNTVPKKVCQLIPCLQCFKALARSDV